MYLSRFPRNNEKIIRDAVAYAFRHSAAGAYYYPRPEYLYQDAAGTTPVSADGDPVGLMLDVRLGAKRGPEIVINGTFDTDSNWNTGTAWTISGGTASQSGTSNNLTQSGIVPLSGYVEVLIDILNIATGSIGIRLGGGSTDIIFTTTGSKRAILPVQGSDDILRIVVSSSAVEAEIDNVSVRTVSGNHAEQTVADSRPTYRTDGLIHWLELDGIDDYMTILGSASAFKFMHDGTGMTVLLAVQCGVVSNPDSLYCLLSSSSTSSTIGANIFFDDRSGSSANDTILPLIQNGSGTNVISDSAPNGSADANTPIVVRINYETQSGDDFFISVNGDQKNTESETGSPSSSNSTNAVGLFRRSNDTAYLNGRFYGGMFIDRIFNSLENRMIDKHFAKLARVEL